MPDETDEVTVETTVPPTTTEVKSEPKPEAEGSLLNSKDAATEGAPDSYSAFTLPEGFEANEEVMTEAQGIFKELGLPQAGAQKLVDLYSKVSSQAAEAPFKLWTDTQRTWVDEIKADPEIGGKLGQVKSTVAKALDGLGDAKLAQSFREAMDFTGAGNNPAFIRTLYKLAQKVTEGQHVGGAALGKPKPASAAQAMYPDLPSGT